MEQLFAAVDVRYLLIENYKRLGLNEKQLAVLLVIDHLLRQSNMLVTADLLALKMTLPLEEIDGILVVLVNKNMLEYNNEGNSMKTTLDPLRKLLYRDFQINVIKRSEENARADFADQVSHVYATFEKEWARTLSPLEFERIRNWISYGYTDQMIIDALQEALASNKKSIRSIDKILLKRTVRSDREKEGYSAASEEWEKDIEKTIEIAQTKWLDDAD